MIPHIIHYCWFGRSPLPSTALQCITSWKRFFPEFEIKEWNEDNFNVNINSYTSEAYKERKYAFVSDYARFWILYKYGGLYFDTDVEVIRFMTELINMGAFMGCEQDEIIHELPVVAPGLGLCVNPGLGLCANPGLGLYKEILCVYEKLHFKSNECLNLKTVVQYTTEVLLNHGLKNVQEIQHVAGITIYPAEYFCPLSYKTGKLKITERTYTIHHYNASWVSRKDKLKKKIQNILGNKVTQFIVEIKHKIRFQ